MQSAILVLFIAATVSAQWDRDDICRQEINPGPCRGYFRRFAFDPLKGRCVQFAFGGCFGNDNNFETLAECIRTCGSGSGVIIIPPQRYEDKMVRPDVRSELDCMLPIKSGRCLAYMPRFGFDASRGKCVQFIYGGCGGNANNFDTMEECESTCRAYIPMPIIPLR
ncbi:hypothetical protein Aduo_003910 [Ancylostoma duodenale]